MFNCLIKLILFIFYVQLSNKIVLFNKIQSQFIEKGFKKAENSEQNVVLLLFLLTLENFPFCAIRMTQKASFHFVHFL